MINTRIVMIKKIVVFILFYGYLTASYADEGETVSNPIAAHTRYNFVMDFDAGEHALSAVETVHFVNTTNTVLDELHFNIYSNKKYTPYEKKVLELYQSYFKVNMFPEGLLYPDLDLISIKAGNKSLSYNITGPAKTVLVVSLDSPIKKGQDVELVIEFKLKLPNAFGILGYYRGINSFGHWYPILSVYKNDRWHDNPIGADHQPYFSDASYYDVELNIDANQVVAHTGDIVSVNSISDLKKQIKIKTGLVRDFTLATSSLYKVIEQKTKGVNVKFYYLQEDEDCAREGLKLAVSAMDFYIETFGPYPYPEFSIAEGHIGWLGNEFSNIIFIDSRGFNLPDVLYRHLDFLISHEMAHQWWYVQVGSDQYAETWLDEAFACYAGNLYLESKYGVEDNYLQFPKWSAFLPNTSFRAARTQRYLKAAKNNTDEKILQPINAFKSPENVFIAAYDKGFWVLEMLRYLVGDKVFFEIMREYVKKYQYKTANVEDFVNIAEEISGEDLDWFFREWLTTTEKCDYGVKDVCANQSQGLWSTAFTIEKYGEIVMPVDILVETEDGNKIIEKWDGRGDRKSVV